MNQPGGPESEFWPAQDGSTPVEPRSYDKRALAVLEEVLNSPLPEDTEVIDTPQYVQNSLAHVRKLSLEQQSKIAYYRKNGKWYIDLDGIKVSLQNESAEHNPEKGINLVGDNTYFSQIAAVAHAGDRGQSLPTNALWRQMEEFLGGFDKLRDILQIPFNGWFYTNYGRPWDINSCSRFWSADIRGSMYISSGRGVIGKTGSPLWGYSVRLLDN